MCGILAEQVPDPGCEWVSAPGGGSTALRPGRSTRRGRKAVTSRSRDHGRPRRPPPSLAAIGGVFLPLSQAPHHAWAIDALSTVVNAGAGIGQVLVQLAVLLVFAGLFFTIAVVRFRRVLVGAA
jgi:hypothetical protein